MLSKEEIKKAKETMKHWVEYEKQNKDKINKADELIEIQETLLQYIDQLETDNSKLIHMLYDCITERKINIKIIDEMAKFILKITNREESELNIEKEKQYFRKKVDENENENELY